MTEKVIFDFSELEGRIKQHYKTQRKFASAISMSLSSLNQKLNNRVEFTSQNIKTIARVLHIKDEDIGRIFFKEKV